MKFQAEKLALNESLGVKLTCSSEIVFNIERCALSVVLLCSHAGGCAVAGLLGYKYPPGSDEGFRCSCHSKCPAGTTGSPQVRFQSHALRSKTAICKLVIWDNQHNYILQ